MTNSDAAKKAGVMGWPIAHSLSPRLHGYWLNKYEINGEYLPLPVPPDALEQKLRELPRIGYRGVNLTVPHKESAIPFLDSIDDVARRIGAVNTVFVTADGTLSGTNTDAEGFLQNIKANTEMWSPSQGPAVVLGAGGSSRAVVASLVDAGCPLVIVVNRTVAKAETLADHIGGSIRSVPWTDRNSAFKDAVLLVNTTTLGLEGQPPLDIDLQTLPTTAIVSDLVYAPLETPLLKVAKTRGNPVVDGLGMLLHQAVPGFEGWFGIRPDVTDDLRTYVLADRV